MIRIISNFVNGGGSPQLQLYIRDENLDLVPIGNVVTNVTSCLKTNATLVNSPNTVGDGQWDGLFQNNDWTFTPKNGTAGTYPAPLFFEGVIDFTNAPNVDLCFNEFLLETRNSQSLDASLQDFVAGDFTVKPPRPVVDIQEATLCDTLTSPRLIVRCPTFGTYTLKQTGESDRVVQNTATDSILFANLKAGKGFEISVNSGGCPSDITDCNNYTTNSCPPTSQSLQPQSTTSASGISERSDISPRIGLQTKITAVPNPFNDKIKFSFESAVSGEGSLELYNMQGQKVKTVYRGYFEKGRIQTIDYNVPDAQRSTLIYILSVGDQRVTGKLIGLNK